MAEPEVKAALEVLRLRLLFEAHGQIAFPVGKSGNVLRGALGMVLQGQVPEAQYAEMFSPRAADGPSGFRDLPRAFVIRAAHLDGMAFEAGQRFEFDLHLFDRKLSGFVEAFSRFDEDGLGAARARVTLTGCEEELVRLPLLAAAGDESSLRVRFVTPTELKSGSRVVERPEFGILMARVRDRIGGLCERYGSGRLDLDFRSFGERAAAVRMTRCDVRQVDVMRRSSRTGQTHSIGGFVGEAEYEGAVGEFVPWLKAAWWTGVGRQTVWGKGVIEVGGASEA